VVDLDTALGQQLLDVPIGQAVAEVPADRDRDHLRWEPEPDERGPVDVGTGRLEVDAPAQPPRSGVTITPRARPNATDPG
jgi:hypothetical protein